MAASIAVVDYCKGNLASVTRGLADAGFDARITDKPADILAADGIVLPGVGAFTDAMTTMEESGQADALRQACAAGMPFLGICLGVQLIFDWGDEGCAAGERTAGLGLLPGHVERMAAFDEAGQKFKIPHVGWNSVEYVDNDEARQESHSAPMVAPRQPANAVFTARSLRPPLHGSPLFEGLPDGSHFYFTHSYCAMPDDPADIVATTEHARRFVSVVAHDNVYGVQFHPEKSSTLGLRVLENFGRIVEAASL